MQSVLEVLDKCAGFFAEKGVPDPKFDAQTLLARALGCKRLELFLHFEKPITEAELAKFREFARRRAKREPLQHILGDVDFFGVKIKCDRRALVPRPETEELLDIIAQKYFADPAAKIAILDLGTGTGAIALALEKHFPNAEVRAVDFSDAALELARENAAALGSRVEFAKSDWFSNIAGKFDLIVANPPYLTRAELESAQTEVRQFDPVSALVAEDEGAADLKKIISAAPEFLNAGGLLACECGLGQPERLAAEFAALYAYVETAKDLSRRTRYLFCRKA